MGSEAPPVIEFNLTGFKKFHGVTDNPTETLMSKIEEHMRKTGMPPGTVLGTCTILETAGEGALTPLMQLLDSTQAGVEPPTIGKAENLQDLQLGTGSMVGPDKRVVWVRSP